MNELVRPDWRDGKAYTESLGTKRVKTEVIAYFKQKHSNSQQGLKANPKTKQVFPSAEEEAKYFLPSQLEDDLRIVDLSNIKYWTYMFLLTICFLVGELLVTRSIKENFVNAEKIYIPLVVTSFIIVIFLILYSAYLLNLKRSAKLVKYPALVRAVPVILLSGALLGIHFYLVWISGGRNSPFLPALWLLCLLVIGLPRENAPVPFLICLVTLVLGIIAGWKASPVNLQEWGGPDALNRINLLTFVFFSCSTISLRWFDRRKIPS